MGQALYRKYRSKSFDEVVGQEHITKTLQNAVERGKISHAYLFTGPRGVGKTSVARILAHAVNDLPYESETIHLDIIEIDAASNRRIDEIRDLRDKVHVSPTSAKYKVYIIDEVHMLTREAFNALLKTLEEPPAHVIFILATTEVHKLPDTIISRTQRHNFKAVSIETAARHLADIAGQEKIAIDEPALRLLAQFGDGSFRDSISLLDQLAATGEKIDEELVRQHLGLPPSQTIDNLLGAVSSGDTKQTLHILNEQRDQAIDATALARLLAERVRHNIINGHNQVNLLRGLLDVSASPKPFDSLELALLEQANQNQADPADMEPVPADKKPKSASAEIKADQTAQKAVPTQPAKAASGSFDLGKWAEVLAQVKSQTPALYTALRLASPSIEGDAVSLAFEFPLHQKKVNQAVNKETVAEAIEAVSGHKVSIDCIVDKAVKTEAPVTLDNQIIDEPADPSLQTISSIFGSAEVLES